MAWMSRRTFVGALPFAATGLSTLVRAEVAAPSAATLFQNVRIFDGKSRRAYRPLECARQAQRHRAHFDGADRR